MDYIAHMDEFGNIQTVNDHCENTAKLAESFSIGELKQINYAIGKIHDIGKVTDKFQLRIKGKKIAAPHAMYGAQEIHKLYGTLPLAKILEFCIAGHHAGIPDIGTRCDVDDLPTLYATLQREADDYSGYKNGFVKPEINWNEVNQLLQKNCSTNEDLAEKLAFITRYCFSCLTDADSIDTEEFCTKKKRIGLKADFAVCLERVNRMFSSFQCTTDLQRARGMIQKQVFDKKEIKSEVYLMNMPTGSGKTICSLKFALERAIISGKKRIIYIIPYNSIIEQTAEVFETIMGDAAQILRHQSTYSYENDSDLAEDYRLAAKKATENWDAQIIVTTAVQFFESIYGNKRGKLRKLHNMAESMLIFDEAHMMPVDYLQPCLRAVSYLTKDFDSEAIFLTATMPDFDKLFQQYALPDSNIMDLIIEKKEFEKFDKCRYVNLGKRSDEEILRKSAEYSSCLIVVNKRKTARKLYELCGGRKFHLSTYMTAYDRRIVIEKIKEELDQLSKEYPNMEAVPAERRITVISTSLIEAGVDLDFYSVFRQLSGLDSILQCGGRCNREGKRKRADVFIFERNEETGKAIDERTEITSGILKEYENIASEESIRMYYDRLFFLNRERITSHSLTKYCGSKPWQINFRKYSEEFEMISDAAVSVVAPENEESRRLIEELKYAEYFNVRKLQKYTFSIYQYELDDLIRQHAVDDFGKGVYCLINPEYYDKNIGITFESKDYII